MKNKILIVLFLMLSTYWVQAQRRSAISIGYYAGQSPAKLNSKDSINTSFVGNGIVASKNTQVGEASVALGMPHDVNYFPTVFPQDVFASKGFFAEYVQLRWNILAMDDVITKVQIFRKPLGEPGDSILIANVATDDFSYRDEFADKGRLYKYTLFAKGIADDLRMPYINYVEVVGFAFPFGTVSGKITYEGGTAVPGVQVLAETKGNLKGKALLLDADKKEHVLLRTTSDDEELDLSEGFTLQMWTHFTGDSRGVLFSRNDIELAYEPGQLSFTVQDVTLDMPYNHPVDTFFHVSAVYNPADGLHLYAHVNDENLDSAMIAGGSLPSNTPGQMYIGRDFAGDTFFPGWVDEARLWARPLGYDEVFNTFSRYIGGTEEDLVGYWSMNEGSGDYIYDVSREGFNFNENHGRIFGGEWSETTPFASQLAYRGVTDENGDYFITGFPYETQGSQYRIIPTFGVHEFDPAQRLLFFGDGANIHNAIDFKDISSFPVSGTIYYKNTPFPVEGVSLLVDNSVALNAEGFPVTTDNKGEFKIDVPIGFHNIRAALPQHGFEGDGYFPPLDENGEPTYFDFQEPLAGLEFQDTTTIRLGGRVVGGPVEAEKLLGFGLSDNNIGNATIRLRPVKLADLTFREFDSLIVHEEDHFTSSTSYNIRDITVEADPSSGEWVTLLPPEEYVVTNVTTKNYVFDQSYLTRINMKARFGGEEVIRQDTLLTTLAGDTLEFNPISHDLFDSVFVVNIADSAFTIATDTFRLDHRNDFVLRLSPSIEVIDEGSLPGIYGDTSFVYVDENLGIEEELSLIDKDADNIYSLGHPVFSQRKKYKFEINLFEEYINEANEVSRVPVTDGEVAIINEMAINDDEIILELDDKGSTKYTFSAGLPNIALNETSPELSYTLPLTVTAFSGNNGALKTEWRSSEPFYGIVLGAMPTGNNFVTTGPNQIVNILRDPPGSASYTYLEEGTSTSVERSYSFGNNFNSSTDLTLGIGTSVTTFQGGGIGAFTGTINEASTKATVSAGLSVDVGFSSDNSTVETVTSTRTISTSDAPELVGADGDVFVGYSTNLVYGLARDLTLIPITDCQSDDCLETNVIGYKLGLDNGIRINPEFETFFLLSQFTLVNYTIPGLLNIRNDFLVHSTMPDTINPISEPVYVSLVPESDERFGSDNFDEDVWGDEANTLVGEGPSYVIKVPQSFIDDEIFVNDTVMYYNQQVREWEFWLAYNERQKLQAETERNVTFDGNVTLEESETTAKEESETFEFNTALGLSLGFGTDVDFSVFGVGMNLDIQQSFSNELSFSTSNTQTVENETTYGFTLSDGDLGDTYTVDIKKPADGWGPVFSTRGGATSCPYEDEVVTKYYKPGEVLSVATAQREVPSISVDNNVVANVPDNREATFDVFLRNFSETGDGFEMGVGVVSGTNPNGASILLDGSEIGSGLVFNVPANGTVNTTLAIAPSGSGETDYENIGIMLYSLCQSDPNDNLPEIADTVYVSAYFVPGCSDLDISLPQDNWVINTRTPEEGILNLNITDYDLNFPNFERIDYQYRPAGTSQWITDMKFYNDQVVSQVEFDDFDDPKAYISGPNISYRFDMNDLPDREYEIRAVSRCVLGPGSEVFTPTEVLSGVKDVDRPKLFGAPNPADGILSADDEIRIKFDESIQAGLINRSSFSMTGVLNSTEISHNASVNFDGVNDYVKIPVGLDIGGGSWTIEWWMKRQDYNSDQVFFSMGVSASDIFEVGVTAGNKLYFRSGGQVQESVNTLPQDVSWNHLSVTYNAEENQIYAYMNDEYFLEQVDVTVPFSGYGEIALGKSLVDDAKAFQGNIHELRIWTRYRQLGDVVARMHEILSGNEVSLVGYWPMDEAIGNYALDKSRFRNALIFADWEVSPKGYAYAFDGVSDVIEINTASTVVVSEDMDMTIEFWFNGENTGSPMVMFASGKGDGTDFFNAPENSLSIGFDANGELFYLHNGNKLVASTEESLLDQNWHHFAVSLYRAGNTNMFVDGELVGTTNSDEFGGLSGASMWIGARGYKVGPTAVEHDQYFQGGIDEFRIWNTTKRQAQIELNLNSRLQGDEVGLMAYYPFEYYETLNGIKIMNNTLEDQLISDLGSGGLAVATGNNGLNQEGPNIKDARPVTTVDFTWVVNDDEIILTPSETFVPLIEQTVLEIGLRTVEDLYENRLASPVTWTAFVDRNPVKWSQDQIVLEKEVYDSYTFTLDVVNRGGTEQNFSIDYLPAWLTANPASGVLEPLSTQTVTFTINEGLNTGYYLEDIYLSSDFGYDEKLTIDLSVMSPDPGWEVSPSDFQYSMNIVAQLTIADIISNDVNDQIAVFVDDEIRGVANLQYVSSLDLYEAFLDVYSNQESGETLELRVWDASAGIEYRQATPDYTFSNNALYGTPQAPEMIVAGEISIQTINMAPGWNWVSFNRDAAVLDNVNQLLAEVESQAGDQIKGAGQNNVAVYTQGVGWLGPLAENGLEIGGMYQTKIQNGGKVSVIGTVADTETQIDIQSGWNYLGYVPRFNMTVNEAFAFFTPRDGDIIKSQFAFAVYQDGLGWIGSLRSLQPGLGYFYKSAQSGAFKYPAASLLNGRAASDVITEWGSFDRHQYPETMTMIAELQGGNDGDLVIVKDLDGNIRGVGEQVDGLYYLSIHGASQSETFAFTVFDSQLELEYPVDQVFEYAPLNHKGTVESPYLIAYQPLGTQASMFSVYPNPVGNVINIQLRNGQMLEELRLVDISGKEIAEWKSINVSGAHEIKSSELNLKAGVYVLRALIDGNWTSTNLIKE